MQQVFVLQLQRHDQGCARGPAHGLGRGRGLGVELILQVQKVVLRISERVSRILHLFEFHLDL
eukprot:1300690-Lingulodinium_polyedra.AAC.1